MAIVKQIEIKANTASAVKNVEELKSSINSLEVESKGLTKSMQGMGNSVLDNGDAMGLLNDLTGGLAMTVKDAVEATDIFTKSTKAQTVAQKMYSAVVGTSTGAMKTFKVALASTGIGLLLVALASLIANFDKVKNAVLNLIPGLSKVADFFGNIINTVTDFIGVTSDATRALDKFVKDSEKALKANERFLDLNGYKYDEFTNRKIKANIDFNKKVQELNEEYKNGEIKSIEELNSLIAGYRRKANDEIISADKDRDEKLQKAREENAKRIAEENQKRAEENKRRAEEAIRAEQERLKGLRDFYSKIAKEIQDLTDKTDQEKLDRQKERDLLELENLKLKEEEKERAKYMIREKYALLQQELDKKQLDDQDAFRQQNLDGISKALKSKADAEFASAENAKMLEEGVKNVKVDLAGQTMQLIGEIAGEGSKVAKGVAVAQATIAGIEGVQNAFKTANANPITAVFPAYPYIQAGLAGAFSALQIKKILSTDPSKGGGSSGVGGGGTPSAPSAPSFNLVQGTGSNQIAESLANERRPIKAYVTSKDVSSGQELDRNAIDEASI